MFRYKFAVGYLPLVNNHMVCVGVPHETKAYANAKSANHP
jgi:hypothetical protein